MQSIGPRNVCPRGNSNTIAIQVVPWMQDAPQELENRTVATYKGKKPCNRPHMSTNWIGRAYADVCLKLQFTCDASIPQLCRHCCFCCVRRCGGAHFMSNRSNYQRARPWTQTNNPMHSTNKSARTTMHANATTIDNLISHGSLTIYPAPEAQQHGSAVPTPPVANILCPNRVSGSKGAEPKLRIQAICVETARADASMRATQKLFRT